MLKVIITLEALKPQDWTLRDWTMTGMFYQLPVEQRWHDSNRSRLLTPIVQYIKGV